MRNKRERLWPVALLVASLMAVTIGMAPAGAQTTRSCDDIFTQLDLVLDAEDAVFELPPGFARDTQLATLGALADRLFDEARANGCLDDDDDDEPIGPDYVALGDSYASGEGNAPYDPDTDSLDRDFPNLTNLCHRSLQGSYPEYLADIEDLSLTNVTCSGAVTFDIYSRNQRNFNEPPQVNAITSETDLITITIGGNDVGFDDIVRECVQGNQTYDRGGTVARSDCRSSKGLQTFALINRFLSSDGLLGRAYDAVNERIADVGADAKVFVVGYPQLFNNLDGGNDRLPACPAVANRPFSTPASPGITRREMGFLYDAVHVANEAIRVVAEDKGFTFVDDVENAFGEEGAVCGSDPLVRGVDIGFDPRRPAGNSVVVSSSFHPTADGQAIVASVVAAEVFG